MKCAKIAVYDINHMGDDLTVVNAARISFAGESQVLAAKDEKLIAYLAKNLHMSPFEHCQLTLMIECPLYIRSQIHRHRTFAYNEISRRYTEDGLEFYLPPEDDVRTQSKNNKQASGAPVSPELAQDALTLMQNVIEYSENVFESLIAMGVTRETARGILPQCLMTKFYMSGNLRNFAHFVGLRDHAHAQKEAQYIARATKTIMAHHFPIATAALMKYLPQPKETE